MTEAMAELVKDSIGALLSGNEIRLAALRPLLQAEIVRLSIRGQIQTYKTICGIVVGAAPEQNFGKAELTKRFPQLLWFAQTLFARASLRYVDAVQEGARHLTGLGAYRAAVFMLLAERRVRRSGAESGGPRVRGLIELAIALDSLEKRRFCTKILAEACELCVPGEVDDFNGELAFRLLSTRRAFEADLDGARECMSRAWVFSEAQGYVPLQVHTAWILSICNASFAQTTDGKDAPLMFVAIESMRIAGERVEVAELYKSLHASLRGFKHIPDKHLAALATEAIARVVEEFPDVVESISERLLHDNNRGNALLQSGKHEEARSCFETVIESATRELGNLTSNSSTSNKARAHKINRLLAPFRPRKEVVRPYFVTISEVMSGTEEENLRFQLAVAYGGAGFAKYNLADSATTDIESAWGEAIDCFNLAEEQYLLHRRFWQACDVWAYRAVAYANIGNKKAAINDVARALFSGRASSDPESWIDLDGLLNADDATRLACALAMATIGHLHSACLLAKLSVRVVHDDNTRWSKVVGNKHLRSRVDTHHRLATYLSLAGRHNEAEEVSQLIRDEWISSYRETSANGIEVEEALAFTSYETAGLKASGLMSALKGVSIEGQIGLSAADVGVIPLTRLNLDIADAHCVRKADTSGRGTDFERAKSPELSAVLRYSIGESNLLISAMVGTEYRTASVPVGFAAVSSLVFSIRQYCRGRVTVSEAEFFKYSRWLHDILIVPVLEWLPSGTRRLYIDLMSPLGGLPFEVLFNGEKYLVEQFEIIQLEQARSTNTSYAAVQRTKSCWLNVFACHDVPGSELPGAALELDAIIDEMANAGANVVLRPFSGSAATTEAFLSALAENASGHNIVHLATHASFNASSEAISSLLFSDGALSVKHLRQEIENLRCHVDLLIMSACGTARQDVDVAGFVATLLRGGVRAVLATLWETVDESAPHFFRHFYGVCSDLTSPVAVATAIRAAQLAMLRDGRRFGGRPLSHPVHWAPYRIATVEL